MMQKKVEGMEERFVCGNIGVEKGRLQFAGCDVCELAAGFGTPLYLLDEERIRHNCRVFAEAFRKNFRAGSEVCYASKANAITAIYRIVREEGLSADVVSVGEILTAKRAGFPMEKLYFHGNNKTDEDIRFALDQRVGCFAADNREELEALEREAGLRGQKVRVLLRITPGIDPHTYAAISTGQVDSKFGTAVETGQAEELVRFCLGLPHVCLEGFHCHVGSQVFGEDVFERAARVMLRFAAKIRDTQGYTAEKIDLGGGFGVPYLREDGSPDIPGRIAGMAAAVKRSCAELRFPEPVILAEPGRSIVADAGMTVYTVGSVKRITGYKNYVSVDGGMTDNPRSALYGARYTAFAAGRMDEEACMTADLAGRCCESGDIITKDAKFPETVKRGDIIAVATTGAYNYSMASNYNRLPRPAVLLLGKDGPVLAVKRETPEDLVRLDI